MARLDREVLRDVSRSFYLSLRLLPGPMRPAVSVGYLLARASDTLADTHAAPVADRVALLDGFAAELDGGSDGWRQGKALAEFRGRQTHAGEKALLERLGDCFAMLDGLRASEAEAVRKVLRTILSGQRLDLTRFENAGAKNPVVLTGDAELEEYCFRVAGCVGVFWTELGFLTLGRRFSGEQVEEMERLGANYGQGLQLVNILRDLPEDLAQGRCYLPVDPADREALAMAFARWQVRAEGWLADGENYCSRLPMLRLRAASVLPALLGMRTLEALGAQANPLPPAGVKVSRREVRSALWRALVWRRECSSGR